MTQYTRTAKALHWVMAVLIVCLFALGITMVNIHGLTPTKLRVVAWHKWLGVTAFALACVRLLWRLFHPAPPLPGSVPRWQRIAARAVEGLLYGLIFAVPVSGYLFSLASGVPVTLFGVVPLPELIGPDVALKAVLRSAHFWLNMTLLTAVTIHALAALKHHFVDHDDVLKRMLP